MNTVAIFEPSVSLDLNAGRVSSSLIPAEDVDLYAALPPDVKAEFDYIEAYLPSLIRAKSLRAACAEVAVNIGLNSRQLYDRVLKYLDTHKWQCLVNKAKAGAAFWQSNQPVGLPVSFQKYYQKLCEEFQRVDRGGYRELMHQWRTHKTSSGEPVEKFPGYDKWPEPDKAGRHPKGWSYKNLNRFAPDNYDSAATRQGAFAASKFRPPVFKTRVGLKLCEQVEFDDHEYNAKIHFPGQPKVMRPLGFTAAERLSASLFPCFKPMLWLEDEDKKQKLTEVDMMWFVIRWLTNVGYRTDKRGTDFIVELGTAAIKRAFAERIFKCTHGKVRVCLPGKFNRPAHKGQFAPRSKGNFKHKALVESSFNIIDNFFSALPGQVGLNRLTCPEELHGREHYFKQLLKVAESIPADDAAKLQLPFLTWNQFLTKGYELYHAIVINPEHNLEGWDELGYHATEYRLPIGLGAQSGDLILSSGQSAKFTDWQPMPEIGTEAYGAVMAQLNSATSALAPYGIDGDFALTRARNLSRAEVFHMEHQKALHSGEIVKLSPWLYCELVGVENGHRVVVNDQHLFVIDSEKITLRRSPLRYLAQIAGGKSARQLKTGEEYLAFVNPFSPRIMLLCNLNGSAIGLCEQWESPCANDEEAILRQVGKQASWEADRRAQMNERHADTAADLQHWRDHNTAIAEAASQRQLAEDNEAEHLAKTAAFGVAKNTDAAIKDQLSRTDDGVPTRDTNDQWE